MILTRTMFLTDTDFRHLRSEWEKAAIQASIEYGMDIVVGVALNSGGNSVQSIHFEVGEYRFAGLNDLRRALNNKAFM